MALQYEAAVAALDSRLVRIGARLDTADVRVALRDVVAAHGAADLRRSG